jgi:hypothetical protein
MTERKAGHSRLVYNKATRTIDTVSTLPLPAIEVQALAAYERKRPAMLHSKALLDLVAYETGHIYVTAEARAAYRAGMSTAAAACDYTAREFGSHTKMQRVKASAATFCGDMIDGLRATISVRDEQEG